MDGEMILDVITLIVVAVGGALAAGVKKAAEDGAAGAVQNARWPAQLTRELEKTRAVERQELRFASYGSLWATLRPLAVYDWGVVNREKAIELSKSLSDWYFSERGGLMMTAHVRDFYFTLQDLLHAVAEWEWEANRSPEDPAAVLRSLLELKRLNGAMEALDKLKSPDLDEWPGNVAASARRWRKDIAALVDDWNGFTESQRFAVLQQAGSILRTALAKDVESRLR